MVVGERNEVRDLCREGATPRVAHAPGLSERVFPAAGLASSS
jgi:hypothetical protein